MRTLLTLWMLLSTSALLLLPTQAQAATIMIQPDGSGDYATIQLGVTAAAFGDTVLLANGTYTGEGNRDISFEGKAIRVASESGDASLCTIDCQGSSSDPHHGFIFHNGEGPLAKLADITIRNGYVGAGVGGAGVSCDASSPTILRVVFEDCSASSGGGFYAINGGSPSLFECSFIECTGWNYHGGAVWVRHTNADFYDCYFKGNSCQRKGGAMGFFEAGPVVSGCTFIGNISHGCDPYFGGGAIHIDHCIGTSIDQCTFIDNYSDRGGAVYDLGAITTYINRCTFTRNSAIYGSSMFLRNSNTWIVQDIIAFGQAGERPVFCAETSDPQIHDCCVFGNASGDSLCGSYNEIIYVDPLFCDLWGDDLTLHENSPCLPQDPYDELIGAYGEGCGYSAVEVKSWGAIKAMYR